MYASRRLVTTLATTRGRRHGLARDRQACGGTPRPDTRALRPAANHSRAGNHRYPC
jgi:hypothetical protein